MWMSYLAHSIWLTAKDWELAQEHRPLTKIEPLE